MSYPEFGVFLIEIICFYVCIPLKFLFQKCLSFVYKFMRKNDSGEITISKMHIYIYICTYLHVGTYVLYFLNMIFLISCLYLCICRTAEAEGED